MKTYIIISIAIILIIVAYLYGRKRGYNIGTIDGANKVQQTGFLIRSNGNGFVQNTDEVLAGT